MKGWATFLRIIGTILIILSLFVFIFSPAVSLGMIVSAFSCLFFAGLCDRITEILENQKKIIIMVDNLRD